MATSHMEEKLKAYKADGVIAQFAPVKYGSDDEHVAQAGAGEKAFGFAKGSASAAEDVVEVYMPGGGGEATVNGVIVGGASVKVAASGKVALATADTWAVGILLDAGTADGDVCEVVVHPHYVSV